MNVHAYIRVAGRNHRTLWALLGLVAFSFQPARALDQPDAPSPSASVVQVCDKGSTCFPNGFISYHGCWIESEYITWASIQHTWPLYKSWVAPHFSDIRNRLHARGVRLLVHTRLLKWQNLNQPGVSFPVPTSKESPDPAQWGDIQRWRDILDTAKAAGLEVFLVMLLPEQEDMSYYARSPNSLDDFYARNNVALAQNVYAYWGNFFDGVLGTFDKSGQRRADNLMYLDILGDFHPREPAQLEWLRALWPNFHSWFTYIHPSRKVLEIHGNANAASPASEIVAQIEITRRIMAENRWAEPAKYGVQAYAAWSWISSDASYHLRFQDMIARAAAAAGGMDKIIVEEIGVDHCPGKTLNDNAEGLHVFSAFFAALVNLEATTLPVGIWEYQDAKPCISPGRFGLLKDDGKPAIGAWVIPWYFGRNP